MKRGRGRPRKAVQLLPQVPHEDEAKSNVTDPKSADSPPTSSVSAPQPDSGISGNPEATPSTSETVPSVLPTATETASAPASTTTPTTPTTAPPELGDPSGDATEAYESDGAETRAVLQGLKKEIRAAHSEIAKLKEAKEKADGRPSLSYEEIMNRCAAHGFIPARAPKTRTKIAPRRYAPYY